MLFTMTGKHIEITEAMRVHAEEKTEKLPRYFDGINQIEVIVDGNDGGQKSVEIIARGERSMLFIAKEAGDDTYACIDIATHKIERQLHRKKEKLRNKKHITGVSGINMSSQDDSEPEEVGDLN
ncbi:MAG: ribosome-associated translation inhibitor RaiA [Anaerohalosphaera sp.]|nr:ribosome-associated translation inhibitor RaiA [Anaerohalosphaera sp.]